jgi:predicted kinase
MDLEHLGRADLSTAFVDAYIRNSGDRELVMLLDFYKCYRAFVRGKVLGFRLGQAGESESIAREARAYFDLANSYAVPLPQPVLVVTMGLPASGKSTLARAIASRCGFVHLSSDSTRKQLAGLRPTMHQSEGFERGLYSRALTRRTYAALRRRAVRWLRRHQTVVLDATFGQPSQRVALRLLARKAEARLLIVVCHAEELLIKARLAARDKQPNTTSDARLDLWPALRANFVEPLEFPDALYIDTAQPLEACVESVLSALRSRDVVSKVA